MRGFTPYYRTKNDYGVVLFPLGGFFYGKKKLVRSGNPDEVDIIIRNVMPEEHVYGAAHEPFGYEIVEPADHHRKPEPLGVEVPLEFFRHYYLLFSRPLKEGVRACPS